MAAVEVNLTGKIVIGGVAASSAQVRSRPSHASSLVGNLTNGTAVKITQQDGNWYYLSEQGGWVLGSYVSLNKANNTGINTGNSISGIVESVVGQVTSISKEEAEQASQEASQDAEEEAARVALLESELVSRMGQFDTYFEQNTLSDKEIADSLVVNNLSGIYGIPYQFMQSVDPRLSGSVMGRKYTEKIISKMPLLCITPGKAEFMSNFSKEEKQGMLANLITGGGETDISDIIKKNGRYYSFSIEYDQYFDYVNGLCRTGARFLDIHNIELNIGGEKALAQSFDWKLALNKKLKATMTGQAFIGFYMDSTDSVSESFGNETTQSQIASTVNSFSDLSKEIGFLLGAGAQDINNLLDQNAIASAMDAIDAIGNKYLGDSPLLSQIGKNFQTVATGGKLLFPEIWADSTFSRNFDINVKLRTPDGDPVSWYLNIYVPLCHLIALAAGHQTDNVNGYYSPFLIRAWYKGLFNIDMGIVTDMSITKGKEAAWTVDGLPTEIDVSITIKDLYNMMALVPGDEPKSFVNNNILMDYIANTCGININQMDIERSLHIYYILTKDKVTDIPSKINRRIQDALDTYGMNFYESAHRFLL